MIYIIGANGFVGSALVEHCHREGRDFRAVTRDNYDSFKGTSCDLLINANGNSKKFLANKDPRLDFTLSVESVLKTTQDFSFKKYVHLSTCDVYTNTTSVAFNAEDVQIDISKLSHYGANKLMAESVVRHYCPSWAIFRLGGMVGANLSKNPIFDLLYGEKLFVHLDTKMQFLNTSRVAEILFSTHERFTHQIVNLAAATPISLRDIYSLIPVAHQRPGILATVPDDAKPFVYEISTAKIAQATPIAIDTRTSVVQFLNTLS